MGWKDKELSTAKRKRWVYKSGILPYFRGVNGLSISFVRWRKKGLDWVCGGEGGGGWGVGVGRGGVWGMSYLRDNQGLLWLLFCVIFGC